MTAPLFPGHAWEDSRSGFVQSVADSLMKPNAVLSPDNRQERRAYGSAPAVNDHRPVGAAGALVPRIQILELAHRGVEFEQRPGGSTDCLPIGRRRHGFDARNVPDFRARAGIGFRDELERNRGRTCHGLGSGSFSIATMGPWTASLTTASKSTWRLSMIGSPAAIAAAFISSQSLARWPSRRGSTSACGDWSDGLHHAASLVVEEENSCASGCWACIQSAACWALLAAVKMARGSVLRTVNHEARYAAWSGRG